MLTLGINLLPMTQYFTGLGFGPDASTAESGGHVVRAAQGQRKYLNQILLHVQAWAAWGGPGRPVRSGSKGPRGGGQRRASDPPASRVVAFTPEQSRTTTAVALIVRRDRRGPDR
jgi:hypothetical protein